MLSSEQISFFKANGYLILPGVMDLELCARVRDATVSYTHLTLPTTMLV